MPAKKKGRPAKFHEPKVVTSITITPTLKRYLASGSESASEQIETMMRKTLQFEKWKKDELQSTESV